MKTTRLVALLSLAAVLSAPGRTANTDQDPYNTYRFNRSNVEMGSPRIDEGPWYEWWYYKVVLDDGSSFFWVYGTVNPWDRDQRLPASQGYTWIGNFATNEILKERVPVSNFEAAYDRTFVRVGSNEATNRYLRGKIAGADGDVSWDIQVEKEWGWNAMGWGRSFDDLVNISWYPAQASARMSGHIDYKGKRYDFRNARGYQDRNWGRSFPDWWFWIVGNDFRESANAALACGGGLPRFFGSVPVLEVVNCGLKLDGREYSFRSTDMDEYKYDISLGRWDITLTSSDKRLKVSGRAPPEKFMDLPFMTPDNKTFHDFETLNGDLSVELHDWGLFSGWKLKKRLTTDRGGLEYGADDLGTRRSFSSRR